MQYLEVRTAVSLAESLGERYKKLSSQRRTDAAKRDNFLLMSREFDL